MTTHVHEEELPTRIVMRLNLELPQDRAIAEWWAKNKGRASKVGRDAIYMRVTGLDPVTGKPLSLGNGAAYSTNEQEETANSRGSGRAVQEIEVDAQRSLILDKLGEL